MTGSPRSPSDCGVELPNPTGPRTVHFRLCPIPRQVEFALSPCLVLRFTTHTNRVRIQNITMVLCQVRFGLHSWVTGLGGVQNFKPDSSSAVFTPGVTTYGTKRDCTRVGYTQEYFRTIQNLYHAVPMVWLDFSQRSRWFPNGLDAFTKKKKMTQRLSLGRSPISQL